ncbi:hypothetical protein LXA43DRAFT_1166244 [Ganoderma leucocontextum]|nr:hypothetical protein LXA43DRAFT_1166244 [Ganoderma leucocontextum]
MRIGIMHTHMHIRRTGTSTPGTTRRGSMRTQPTEIILSLTIPALFASTTVSTVACILAYQSSILRMPIVPGSELWMCNVSSSVERPALATPRCSLARAPPRSRALNVHPISRRQKIQPLGSDTSSAPALIVIITPGDALVWVTGSERVSSGTTVERPPRKSRVRRRRLRYARDVRHAHAPVLPSSDWSKRPSRAAAAPPTAVTTFDIGSGVVQLWTLFEGLTVGTAVSRCALSPGTNLLATLLAGYNAWIICSALTFFRESRSRLWGYLVAAGLRGFLDGETVPSPRRVRGGVLRPLGESSAFQIGENKTQLAGNFVTNSVLAPSCL